MFRLPAVRPLALCAALGAAAALVPQAADAATVAVDPYSMGKGEWVYVLSSARSNTGSTTDAQFMAYLKNKGIKWVVVKCGDYGEWWTQFSPGLITAAHNEGLLIFGYQRVGGTNLTAEIDVGKQCLATAADGYIVDAEVEFNGKATQATQMMLGLRATYPNAFIAHAPLPYIDYHQSFPYVPFGTYCNAVMPQCYWADIGVTPTQMLTDLNAQWNKWQTTWTSQGNGAAVKPIVPLAQGYGTATSTQVTQFINLIKNDTGAANVFGPYQGVSFWSAQHHTSSIWTAIGSATIGGNNGTLLDNGQAGFSTSGTWSTSTTAGCYGADSRYANVGAAATATWTKALPQAGFYDVYAWWTAGSNRATSARFDVTHAGGTTGVNKNQTQGGGGWNLIGRFQFGTTGVVALNAAQSSGNSVAMADAVRFVFKAPVVSEIIVDNTASGFTASSNWFASSSVSGYYGTNYRARATGNVSDLARWSVAIPSTGSYQVFARWTSASDRPTAAPYRVLHSGGTTTVNVNQQTGGGQWVSLGTYNFTAGTTERVNVSCWTTAGYNVIADAVRLVPQ